MAYSPIFAQISVEKYVYFARFLDDDAVEGTGVNIRNIRYNSVVFYVCQ